ncbi:PAS domain-containing sensor histidine kinase [Legionella sp. km772]|uniref:PAS domain-containing hybrid sensor histidine kinase/response regulator n=1 Tax=Legionella sp. km772 TaxID=2498111 RepID=UPI000F8D4703|nr:PAS domain-containing sensor histidine kinase [Legionella sp. km772]RUR13892.1 PAS domain-containing sensor histidine kinase [Legionella sp. km772]
MIKKKSKRDRSQTLGNSSAQNNDQQFVFIVDSNYQIKEMVLNSQQEIFSSLYSYKNKSIFDAMEFLNLDKEYVSALLEQAKKHLFQHTRLADLYSNYQYSLSLTYVDPNFCLIFNLAENSNDSLHSYFNSIINSLPGAIYWKDREGHYLGCNQFVAQMAGFDKPEQIIGKTDFDLCWSEFATDWRILDLQVMRDGKPIKKEEIAKLADGRLITELTIKHPLYNQQNEIVGIIGTSMDISEQKKLQKDLMEAHQQAEAANQAKTEFLENMSHDIRTPVTGVIGLSEILEKALVDPIHKEDAHLLYESGNQLLNMLNEILDDVQAGNSNQLDIQEETFDLRQCLDNLIKLEAPTVTAKNLSLKAQVDPAVPTLIVNDRKKIHHILLNLLGNAIKFTNQGGITLQVRNLKTKGLETTLEFTVSDTGIGIPEDQQAKVFERFFRANPSSKGVYKGYGLGLHIVQSYIALLGGTIRLKSKEGIGTSISFDLVCKIGKQEDLPRVVIKESSAKNLKSSPKEESLHFLLVEDNVIALKVLESMLENQGHRFISATSGEEALELVKLNCFDLIITDIGLPGMSGTELANHIRHEERSRNCRPTPIVGLTGHAPESARPECLNSGMNEVFRKPINSNSLQVMIEQYALINKLKLPAKTQIGESGAQEDRLPELDSFELFDPQDGLKYTNDLILLASVLNTYLSPVVQDDVQKMVEFYELEKWDKIDQLAHRIKAGVACLGTIRLQKACAYIEHYYKTKQKDLLEASYHQFLSVNKATIAAVIHWLQESLKH